MFTHPDTETDHSILKLTRVPSKHSPLSPGFSENFIIVEEERSSLTSRHVHLPESDNACLGRAAPEPWALEENGSGGKSYLLRDDPGLTGIYRLKNKPLDARNCF